MGNYPWSGGDITGGSTSGGPQEYWMWTTVMSLLSWVTDQLNWIWQTLRDIAMYIWAGLLALGKAIWRALAAILHLNFAGIWQAIKAAYDRFRRALDWYQKHVLAPLDRIRRTIYDLYNRFFGPILRVIDQLRVMVRALAIFNRRLAAQIDSALFGLEAKIMTPITYMLQRVNQLSSSIRAVITQLGFLDRVLLMESLRRDALIAWEVLTNPRARIYAPLSKPAPGPTVSQTAADIDVYAKTGGGPMADRCDELDTMFRQAQLDVL